MNRSVKTQGIKTTKLQSLAKEETFCKYAHRRCMQNCVDGYDYCIRHILEDKAAPFKQCTYMTKSGKRCGTAAPKHERKDGYCTEHAKKAFITRQRLSRKRRPKESTETLLDELTTVNSGTTDVHTNENRRSKAHSDSIASKALEYASSSDSEAEALLVEKTWRDPGDSDAESIDSDQEDMLKYAGIYTTEEVAQILRDKLIRLQTLYIDQFKRLKHVLLSKRRQYLQAYKVEKETLGSIKLYKNDPFQKDKYDKLCALKRYHKKFGKEALLQKQSTERRMQSTDEANYTPPHFVKCVFVDEGWRCGSRVVPLSKFCQKHILHDSAQVLYRPCPFADSQCGRPVPTIFNTEYCSLHQPVPPLQEVDHLSVEDSSLQTEDKKDIDTSKLMSEECKESFLHTSDSSNKLSTANIKTEVDPDIKTEVPEASSKVPATDTGEEDHRPRGILFTLGEEVEEEDDQAR
ncbi:KAT8 regulatory NSL complex subunit 2-like isoform X2 [Physella acuta]|uniref:KAT8 regulatory NSL complex subunit 2-like isoform X2 n=1 Tax=Physella acuta TaxID=109671 RepID=UPI0027DAFD75|nr:KAT8 regulatory NSL complex subunit 2-like isoform X2 [Physella acuta]